MYLQDKMCMLQSQLMSTYRLNKHRYTDLLLLFHIDQLRKASMWLSLLLPTFLPDSLRKPILEQYPMMMHLRLHTFQQDIQ